MIRSGRRIVALVPLPPRSPGGLAASFDAPFGGTTVLGHTLRRLARCTTLHQIVLIKRIDDPTPALPDDPRVQRLLAVHQTAAPIDDAMHDARVAARKWSPTAWRGGIGGATCHDEPLAADAMCAAMRSFDASAALIVSPDWPLVDPALCDRIVERHLLSPDALKLVFTQAAPGLAGCLITLELLTELAEKGATIGALIDYNPRTPQGDPIGKDPCVQVDPAVRDARFRFAFDAPRWQRVLRYIESQAEAAAMTLDAAAVARIAAEVRHTVHHPLPQQVHVEINIDRAATGPIVPQHHAAIVRSPMHLTDARRLFRQLAAEPDTAVTIGGLGDPLLHPDFPAIVNAAHEAGLWGIHVETDLLTDRAAVASLVDLPIDAVSVRLNADTAATYAALMGTDGFDQVIAHIEWLLNHRRKAADACRGRGLPWIVPRMVKTTTNVGEVDSFLDRWVYYTGHAVIDGPTTGFAADRARASVGVMPDLSVIDMAPPRRRACRQLAGRMTVHADGRVALCDQDWTGDAAVADLAVTSAATAWAKLDEPRRMHDCNQADSLAACAGCRQWHRP